MKTLITMVASFWGAWTSYLIVSCLQMAGIEIPRSVVLVANFLTKIGVIVNPIVLVFLNKDVSNEFQIWFYFSTTLIFNFNINLKTNRQTFLFFKVMGENKNQSVELEMSRRERRQRMIIWKKRERRKGSVGCDNHSKMI